MSRISWFARFGSETRQFFNDFGDAVWISGKVMSHAEVIPALSIHGLKTDGFLKSLGGLRVIAQAGVSQPRPYQARSMDGLRRADSAKALTASCGLPLRSERSQG